MHEYRWVLVPHPEGDIYHLNCGAETIAIISKASEVDRWKYDVGYKTQMRSVSHVFLDSPEKAKHWVEAYLKEQTDFSKDCTIVE